ncbi:MAG TPA: hypothetical protein VMT85_07800 [Thermoanaerobaculia bacterium]|nr:hypothetical protein [Thermoanaerobaculia bacterium]
MPRHSFHAHEPPRDVPPPPLGARGDGGAGRSTAAGLGTPVPALLALGLLAAGPVAAWTPDAQLSIGRAAADIAPRDFWRQLERHQDQYLEGLVAPFRDRDPLAHQANPDGSGTLLEVLRQEVDRTISMIRDHHPFEQVAYRAGLVVHYVNDANNPLNCSSSDQAEGQYYADFLDYLDSTEPRTPMLFYGLDAALERGDLEGFLERVIGRCRRSYPLVGSEYRRTGKLPGRRYFDDRSTAFGVASVARSRAVTDAALLLRYIWLQAGGADWRRPPRAEEGRLLRLPRDTDGG